MTREDVISWLEYLSDDARSKADGLVPTDIEIACGMAIDALKTQEPRVTCSVCKYSRCLSGEWFCFMIGTSRYGKRVTDGDWYCKDAIGR